MNICRLQRIYNRVRRFRNIYFALAAFLWLPAAAHCQLETLPGLEFLRCAISAKAPADANHGCKDCGGCTVEKSEYRSISTSLNAPAPELLTVFLAPRQESFELLPVEIGVGFPTTAPPGLLPSRHFLTRTALPVRAPSLAA